MDLLTSWLRGGEKGPPSLSDGHFILNIHGIGEAPRPYEPEEKRYWITRRLLEDVLDLVARHPSRARLHLTFDDGNLSDYSVAAPLLLARGLTAIFFVLAGRIGSRGYLSKEQINELSINGFEIGSHGLNHTNLTTTSDAAISAELRDSKLILEDVTHQNIRSFAIPFGRYDRRVLREIMRQSYQRAFSSDGGPRLTPVSPIPRYSLREGEDLEKLSRFIAESFGFLSRAKTESRIRIKGLLR